METNEVKREPAQEVFPPVHAAFRHTGGFGCAAFGMIILTFSFVTAFEHAHRSDIVDHTILWILFFLFCTGVAAMSRGYWELSFRHDFLVTRRQRIGIAVDLVGGYFAAVLAPAVLLLPLFVTPAPYSPDSCANHLKQLGLLLRMFADEQSNGMYPEMAVGSGRSAIWAATPTAAGPFWPEYLSDIALLFCPSISQTADLASWKAREIEHPQAFFDTSSYRYLGYAVSNEKELEALANAFRAAVSNKTPMQGDLAVPHGSGTRGGDMLIRLRDDWEERFVADPEDHAARSLILSSTPVLIERLGNHEESGGHVLFLDGHVEYVKYPGKFPMSQAAEALFEVLELAPGR